MRYIVVDEQDQKLLSSVAVLLGKASFTLDSQEIVGAAQILTNLARLAERVKDAKELPQEKK
jgi:hypothetical protein